VIDRRRVVLARELDVPERGFARIERGRALSTA
jgi:hypothetical protein